MATPTLVASSALTPIPRIAELPIEVIILFLTSTHKALGAARDRCRLPLILSLTCKTWSLIVSATPALWSTVWLDLAQKRLYSSIPQNVKGFSSYLEKSGSIPLDIEIDFTRYTSGIFVQWGQPVTFHFDPPDKFTEVLLSHATRWSRLAFVNTIRHLKYSDPNRRGVSNAQEKNCAKEAGRMVQTFFPPDVQLPMLSSLKLNLRTSSQEVTDFTVPALPQLQTLILQRFGAARLTDWPVRSLRELRVVYKDGDSENFTPPTPFPQLLQAIRSASGQLEVLHVQMVVFPPNLADEIASEDFKTIDMPQLSSLYLIGLPEIVIFHILTRLHMPNLVELAISGSESSEARHWEPVREVFPKLGHLAILGFRSMENWDNQEQFVENMISMAPNITKLSLSLATVPFVKQISDPWAFPHLRAVFVQGIKMGDWKHFVENRGALLDRVAIDVGSLALSGEDYESAFGKDGVDLQYLRTHVKLGVFGRRGVPEDEVLWDKWATLVYQDSGGEDKLAEEDELWQWTRPFSFPMKGEAPYEPDNIDRYI